MLSQRSFTTALALMLALAAIGAPVASGASHAKAGEQSARRAGATIVRVADDCSGFDWADAGIGAAGGFALSVLGVGVVLLVSEHRAQRWSRSRAETRSRSRPST
jgi:hypothetical protein